MINWKTLKDSQLETLGLEKAREDEVVLVDPSASPYGISFMLFEADTVFSEKQLQRYKNVTPTELESIQVKIEEYEAVLTLEEEEE